jgi:hypothetical protein
MNERIRELAIQSHHRYSEHQIDLEKFAELIVKECTGLLEITGNLEYTVNRDPHDYMRGAAIIKRHFRIEEI